MNFEKKLLKSGISKLVRLSLALALLMTFGLSNKLHAQVQKTIDKTDILQISNKDVDYVFTNKGLLIPRMTSKERLTIDEPSEGLLVYDLSKHGFYFFNGEKWVTESISVTRNYLDSILDSLNNEINNAFDTKQKFYSAAIDAGLFDEVLGEANSKTPPPPTTKIRKPSKGSHWSLKGNQYSQKHAFPPVIGTSDNNPLVFITNNIERMRIDEDGTFHMQGSLNVGEDAIIGRDLEVKQDVFLNIEGGSTTVYGPTFIQNSVEIDEDLTVKKNVNLNTKGGTTTIDGPTSLSMDLTVEKDVILNNTSGSTFINGPTVIGGSGMNPSLFTGNVQMNKELVVDGLSDLNGTLTVDGASNLKTTLNVDGHTDLNSTLTIDGNTKINSELLVDGSFPEGKYAASFVNHHSGTADGILIQLGKHKAAITPGLNSRPVTATTEAMKNLISSYSSPTAKRAHLESLLVNEVAETAALIGGITVGVGNLILKSIDKVFDPFKIGPTTLFNKFVIFEETEITDEFAFGPIQLPSIDPIPSLGTINVADINALIAPGVIVEHNPLDPNFWGIPSINFNENTTDPLNNFNEFITFKDVGNQKMGSIRAMSVTNWTANFLHPLYLWELSDALKSSKLDKLHAKYHFDVLTQKAIANYLKLGIEYSSGNGDYAEWLPRLNEFESIYPGDIVAVVGGKITKDLSNAEQVMAVSHQPIVLGNIPEDGKIGIGNNVAFMGQIPVKIVGPVNTGDYIVANKKTPGFGIAIAQENMTIEDFKFAVGRSWDNNQEKGVKTINTVVGIHNGDYFKVLKSFESRLNTSEARFESLEIKVNALLDNQNSKNGSK